MEENNNENLKKVVDEGKKIAKDMAKEALKEPIKKLIITILPYIGIFFLILLVIGVQNAIQHMIQSTFTSIFNSGSSSSASASNQSMISIDEFGAYKVSIDSFADNIKNNLEEKNMSLENLNLITEDFENLLEKYVKAEFQTMLPKTGNSGNDLDGNVIIKRQFADGRGLKNLKYISYQEFTNKINNQDSSVVENFSINPENFHLMIADQSAEVQTFYDYDGKLIDTMNTSSGITIAGDPEEGIDYLPLIQNYGAPFNFFLSMHMITLNSNFMNDLVELVLKNDSPIVLTYVDSSIEETATNNYSGIHSEYVQTRTMKKDEKTGDWEMVLPYETETTNQQNVDSTNIKKYISKYPEVKIEDYWKVHTKRSSGKIYVTSADTWIKNTEKKIEKNTQDKTEQTTPENPEMQEYSTSLTEIKENDDEKEDLKTDENEIKRKYSYSTLEQYTYTVTTINEGTLYTVIDNIDGNKNKVNEIIEFIKKYPDVIDNIKGSPSQLIYFLEKDESTQKLAKVMRYVIFQLTGLKYGITSESEIERLLTDMTSYNLIKGDSAENFIKAWNNDVLWAYETGQSAALPTKYLTADGLNYIVYEDGSTNHNNIAYKWATFIEDSTVSTTNPYYANHEKYGEGKYRWKDEFAAYDIKVEDLSEGSLVNKENATSAFQNEILPKMKQEVNNYLDTKLPNCSFSHEQKDALISIWCEYGNLAGFADAYRNSLDDDGNIDAEKLKANYSRFNYTGQFNDRKYANWILFTEGVYVDRLGNEIAMGGRIVTAAYQVAEHFLNCGYDIHYAGDSVNEATDNGRNCVWGDIQRAYEDPIKYPNTYGVVCATYVSFALWQSGLIDEETINSYGYNACSGVTDMLKNSKYAQEWEQITNWSELREGDIVHEDGHIYIYIDGDKMLDQSYCVKSSTGGDSRRILKNAIMTKFICGYRYVGKKLGE